jgi:hypothetical protein
MLSTAQDYRPGFGGDQQHIWQATFGPDAVCFTTHPGPKTGGTPNHWTGTGCLPRAAQVANVAIVIYNIDTRPGLYLTSRALMTHAWLPRDQFDELVERDGWIFARKGEGYLALRSQHPYEWQTELGEDQDREVVVPGRQNIWICELGRWVTEGGFSQFIAAICQARLEFGRLSVSYHSPSQGELVFGWRGPLWQNGERVPLASYPRYDNPYGRASFPSDDIILRQGDHWLHLHWRSAERRVSGSI